MLNAALKTEGVRVVVKQAVHVCVTGLNPQLHPAERPGWRTRLACVRVLDAALHGPETVAALTRMAAPIKEAMRRCIASIVAGNHAAHVALAAIGHPVRQLLEPPAALPRAGMQAAMVAFVKAGMHVLDAGPSRGSRRRAARTRNRFRL